MSSKNTENVSYKYLQDVVDCTERPSCTVLRENRESKLISDFANIKSKIQL